MPKKPRYLWLVCCRSTCFRLSNYSNEHREGKYERRLSGLASDHYTYICICITQKNYRPELANYNIASEVFIYYFSVEDFINEQWTFEYDPGESSSFSKG